MLHDPARHEPLCNLRWDEDRARASIRHIVADTEARFSPDTYWPIHPRDADGGDVPPVTPLYHGAGGVIWALRYLAAVGASEPGRDYRPHLPALRTRNAQWLASLREAPASYLMGDAGLSLLAYALTPSDDTANRLASLIETNQANPARELMWGAPGTMLAALFMYENTADERWAGLFRASAATLASQLEWSLERQCRLWSQDLYGERSTYVGAVHGFAATASPLIRGRRLFTDAQWREWEQTIATTIRRTAIEEPAGANWPVVADASARTPRLMQFCHGAPGVVICLAQFPGDTLDDLLISAGDAIWAAGPLRKGSNLCHGTAGNGYAFLKLYARTGDPRWLARARAFAMHAIEQTANDERHVGHLRYTLWTGDPGVAIYLWDCIHAGARFPTLDVFFA